MFIMVAPITLHNLDAALLERLAAEARRRAVDVETVAVDWLRQGAEQAKPEVSMSPEQREAFLKLAGTWTKEEADAFDAFIEETFEQIDEEMWK